MPDQPTPAPPSFATITIPSPVARPGEQVEVLNYRKNGDVWERGRVMAHGSVQWTLMGHGLAALFSGRWTYHVRLDRESDRGRALTLTVGSDNIRRVGKRDEV